MQQPTKQIRSLITDTNNCSYELNCQMIDLKTVQEAVGQLMERINEIKHNGWHEDKGMAYLSINEIEQTVRLIDMAFYPLTKKICNTVNELDGVASKSFDLVVRENKKADALTSTNEK